MASLVWDAAAGRYRDAATGRFVTPEAFERSLNAVIDGSRARMAGLAQQLRGGSLTLAGWQHAAAAELKALYVTTGTLAQGGARHMPPAAYGKIGQLLRVQYGYLQTVANEVASGKRPLDGRLDNSGRLFAGNARGTFAQMQRDQARARGLQEERWVRRTLAESCPGCEAQERKGWVPLGALPSIGSQPCNGNCRCIIQTRRAPQEAVA